jgi:hypothetical protein
MSLVFLIVRLIELTIIVSIGLADVILSASPTYVFLCM